MPQARLVATIPDVAAAVSVEVVVGAVGEGCSKERSTLICSRNLRLFTLAVDVEDLVGEREGLLMLDLTSSSS